MKSQLSRVALSAVLVVSSLPTCGIDPAMAAPPSQPAAIVEAKTVAPDTASVSDAFGALPLAFEVNRGQVRPEARYVARGAGFTLFVTDRELVTAAGDAVVRMGFPAARRVTASGELPGLSNYFLGNDPAKWVADVPMFERTTLESVFPGIDLVVYGSNDAPEYDFVVAPGADPSAISVTLEGATSMRIDPTGNLVLETKAGEIRHNRPVLYQVASDGRREPVSGAFMLAKGQVGFRVGTYDVARPLVIDPVLKFSTFLGGKRSDSARDVAVDGSGNVFIAGLTNSTNFPLRNPYEAHSFNDDVFVTKMNATGTALIYSTLIGGSDAEFASGIAVDAVGRAFVSVTTTSATYPMKNHYQRPDIIQVGEFDGALTVLTSAGNDLVYSTALGGRNFDQANDVAVDLHGNAFIVGHTFSERFPVKSPSNLPPFQEEIGDNGEFGDAADGWIAKIDPDEEGETSLVYSTYFGGSGTDLIFGVAVDDFERAYVTGFADSSNFPILNAVQPTFGGGETDAFVAKFNADGTTLFFSTFLGGVSADIGMGIDIDDTVAGDPQPVVVGSTDSKDFPVANAFQTNFGEGNTDAFVTRLEGDGRSFITSSFLGGDADDSARAVAVDSAGNAIVTGNGAGTFPLFEPIAINGTEARAGIFMAKMQVDGQMKYSTFIGDGSGFGVAVDANDDVYGVGQTVNSDFPVTPGAFQSSRSGDEDGVVFKLDIIDDDTVGVWNPTSRTFFARNTNLPGAAEVTAQFGVTGDRPLSGDWNGDGVDTIGVYSPALGQFSLRNANTAGAAEITAVFGAPNLQPIKGDWNGDGIDTIGVFDPASSSFFLRNTNTSGAADVQFTFGVGGQGSIAIAGDWNGDGVDTVGIYAPPIGLFTLINTNAAGNADLQFTFGPASAIPVAGDWNGDTIDTVGVVLPNPADGRRLLFQLVNTNAAIAPSLTLPFGNVGELPVVGNWDGQ